MKLQKQKTLRMFVAVAVAAAILPVVSQAEETAGTWQWRGSLYGWLPTISGSTEFPTGGSGPSIEMDAETILDNLNFTFMAALDVTNGEWGAFTDLIYMDLGTSKRGVRDFTVGGAAVPAGVDLDATLDIKSWVWTVAGTYALSATEQHTTQLLFGARMLDYKQALDWTFNGDIGPLPLPGRSGSREAGLTNWDAIIGLKGRSALGADGKWFIPYHFDIGTGDSDFTWQAMAGLGYNFGWGSAILTWRHLDYEMESGAAVQEADFSGPLFGATWQW